MAALSAAPFSAFAWSDAAFGSALAAALPPDPNNLAPILSTSDSDFSSGAWLGLGLGLGSGSG